MREKKGEKKEKINLLMDVLIFAQSFGQLIKSIEVGLCVLEMNFRTTCDTDAHTHVYIRYVPICKIAKGKVWMEEIWRFFLSPYAISKRKK